MPHYPGSTAATDGSANDFPPLPSAQPAPTFSHAATSQATAFASKLATLDDATRSSSTPPTATLILSSNTPITPEAQRINSWLNDLTISQPHSAYTSEASTAAHLKDTVVLLTAVDEVMSKQ